MSKPLPEKFKTFQIFATSAVFIDESFEIEDFDLILLAPLWEVDARHGKKFSITVTGISGKSYPGKFGEPGGHGLPGKSFFGVANTIKNSEMLTVQAIGGKGGDGQNGVNGVKGKNGFHGYRSDTVCDYPSPRVYTQKNLVGNQVTECTVKGTDGTIGTKGTDGGSGGVGRQS